MNRGLTLLETLAAITLLGVVATAIIPISLRLGQGELGIEERLSARTWLLGQDDPGTAELDLIQPIKGHTGWYLHRRGFLRTSGKPPADARSAPEHGWVHLRVCRGPERNAEILAERIFLLLDDAHSVGTPPP